MFLIAIVLFLDCLVVASVPHSDARVGPLAPFGIVFCAVFVALGYSRLKADRESLPFSWRLFLAHIVCFTGVYVGSVAVSHAFIWEIRIALALGLILLLLAFVPVQVWVRSIHSTGYLWLYSFVAGLLAWSLRYPFQSMWEASSSAPGRLLQRLTFEAVSIVLRPIMPGVEIDPIAFTIGTSRILVTIAEACSGMEGLGLVLVFTTVWLWYFRKESRFPQALLLIPFALISVWILNVLRICILMFVADSGHFEVAMVGFHSQAGWIAFTTVAFGFSMATRKLAWVRRGVDKQVEITSEEIGESPATAAYLVPFLAILGASFLSKAASGYFEWLYPLRFIAAVIALWFYRREYRKLKLRFSWRAPFAGALVFGMWIIPSLWTVHPAVSALGSSLAGLSPAARYGWIAFRIAAAVITVPIAEELAFRGYLARRIMNREFDCMAFRSLSMVAIAVSSIVFGLMHGQQWYVGILAGLIYAGLVKWSGRIGDAVAAHATSNLLLAVWVLSRGDWQLW